MLQSCSSEKKLVQPLKNCFIVGPNLHKKGVIIMGHAQNGKQFFLQIQLKLIIRFQKLFILSKYQIF